MPKSLEEILGKKRSLDDIFGSQPQEEPGIGESALRGVAQGATLGYADELTGAGEAGVKALTGQDRISDLLANYRKYRDQSRSNYDAAAKANPITYGAGNIAGGVGMGLAGGAALQGVKAAAILGGAGGLGYSKADLTEGDVAGAAKDTVVGAAIGGSVAKVLEKAAPAISKYAGDKADELAENAVGATRRQAEDFAPGTGRWLRENNVVNFGSSPADIAENAQGVLNKSGAEIGNVLQEAGNRGVKSSLPEINSAIQEESNALAAKGGGFVPSANKMTGYGEDIAQSLKAGAQNPEELSVAAINKQKASFGNADWTDPEKAVAQKGVYRSLMKLEEKKIAGYKDLADRFEKAKEAYRYASPVQEAASTRSLQLQQHPMFGLNDVASMAVGGPKMAIARRMIGPRVSSSLSSMAGGAENAFASPSGVNAVGRGSFSAITDSLTQKKLDTYQSPEQAAEAFLKK